jgi:tetratricopeptide (TPR) repeat protein
VAVKLARSPDLGAAAGDPLLAEARRVAQLQHPNIVSVLNVDTAGDTYFIVSPLMVCNLADVTRQQRPAVAQTVEVVAVIANAVAHAHLAGIVHRDIKPANVLVDRAGHVYLADFGIALGEGSGSGHGGTGTPAYMAPEQLAGGPIGPAADVWGLGVLLYELLAGRPPFGSEAETWPSGRPERRPPPPPSTWNSHVSPTLDAICQACMATDPTCRPPGAVFLEARLRLSTGSDRGAAVISGGAQFARRRPDWHDPDDPAFYLARGRAWRTVDESGSAEADLTRAIKLDAGCHQAWFERAGVRLMEQFDVVLDTRGSQPWHHAMCCSFKEMLRRSQPTTRVVRRPPNVDLALADYDEAIRLSPTEARYYEGRGDALAAAGDYRKAIADYTEAIRLGSSPSHVPSKREAALRRLEEEADADLFGHLRR